MTHPHNMVIGVDIMGGDYAPQEAIAGIVEYLQQAANPSLIMLFGSKPIVEPLLQQFTISSGQINIIDTPQTIEMQEHPAKAFREKPQSSIAVGFQYLAANIIDAFISAGNTGAMLAGALLSIKPMDGVIRPAISTVIPKLNGKTGLLLDVGLNVDCKPEQLNQFALMGAIYAEQILSIQNPAVGLINVGEEEGKGNLLTKAAYKLLKENNLINFNGNVEGRDIFTSHADIIVTDGFIGNIILKLAESLYEIAQARKMDDLYLNRFNFENYGGTPILGVEKPVIIGHGISKKTAFKNMILAAEKIIQTQVIEKIKNNITGLKT